MNILHTPDKSMHNQNIPDRTVNDRVISTTANEASRTHSRSGSSVGDRFVPSPEGNQFGPCGGRGPGGVQGSYISGINPPFYATNPGMSCNTFSQQSSYVSYPSYFYKYNLNAVSNTPELLHVAQSIQCQSQFGYTAQDLQRIYLFRNENRGQPSLEPTSQEATYRRGQNEIERKEKELVENLRKWVNVSTNGKNKKVPTGLNFTLMSYNVLAQDLITEHAYIYRLHSPRALLWETRWKNLYQEIKSHNADIICLQEVQESHLEQYYSKINDLGFDSIFKKKNGIRTDGCAIYYRKSMFNLIEYFTVNFNQGYFVLDRENIAIVAKLAPKHNPEAEFIVATTHLLYNPKRQDVRVAQTQVLLAEVERMAYTGKDKYLPIIITGDFNAEPYSAVYELVVTGNLKYDNLTQRTLIPTNAITGLAGKVLIPYTLQITDNCKHLGLVKHRASSRKLLSRKEEEALLYLRDYKGKNSNNPEANEDLFSTGTLTHDLALKSAFLHFVDNDLEGTTNQTEWITVDYIFYSGKKSNNDITDNKLQLLSRYSIPTRKQLRKLKSIPNSVLGSDHLALLTKFKLLF